MTTTPNPDFPAEYDLMNPLLAPDDPRATSPEARFEEGEKTPITLGCPLCGEEVQSTYVVTGSQPCESHPGESHEQILIDTRPLAEHESECIVNKILDTIFPDVRQEEGK